MTSTLRRVLTAPTIVVFGILAIPSMAFADTGPVAPITVVGDPHAVTLTPMAWTIITGLILPFIIALVMKASASSTFKGVMAIVLAAVAAIVERATLADGTAVFTTGLLVDVLMVYAPQILTYLGLWQHVNINAKVAPTIGLGGAPQIGDNRPANAGVNG